MASTNSLGLDFSRLQMQELPPPTLQPEAVDISSPPSPNELPRPSQDSKDHTEVKDKKKPYANPERVKTGGNQRDKLSEEELVERMVRMREQNEKIKQRRMDVQADEAAFRKTQELERAKLAQIRKVQENVDRTREQNAKRKMDKIQSREWDSGKPAGDWKRQTGTPEGVHNVIADTDEKGSFPPDPGSRGKGRYTRGASHRGLGSMKGQLSSDAVQGAEGLSANSSSLAER